MKKLFGLIVLAIMVILPMSVNAATIGGSINCGSDTKLATPVGNYTHSKTCSIKATVSEASINTFLASFKYDSSIIKINAVTPSGVWGEPSSSTTTTGVALTFKTSSSVATDSDVATVVFYIDKSDPNKDCTIKFTPCYDENGTNKCGEEIIVTETPKCKIENGKYYGKDGSVVTKEVYEEECQGNKQTGSFMPYAVIASGIALAVIVYTVSRKNNKLYKI